MVRQQPEPEEAARLGIEVLGVPDVQRTETVRKRGTELLELLRPWRAVSAVKEFTDRLHEYRMPQPSA